LLPGDFDPRFWQVACDDLVAIPWLNCDETIECAHLDPTHPLLRSTLPNIELRALIERHGEAPLLCEFALDGVHLDLRGMRRATLTWRGAFLCPEREGKATLRARRRDGSVEI
jgi:hypothetical protein